MDNTIFYDDFCSLSLFFPDFPLGSPREFFNPSEVSCNWFLRIPEKNGTLFLPDSLLKMNVSVCFSPKITEASFPFWGMRNASLPIYNRFKHTRRVTVSLKIFQLRCPLKGYNPLTPSTLYTLPLMFCWWCSALSQTFILFLTIPTATGLTTQNSYNKIPADILTYYLLF